MSFGVGALGALPCTAAALSEVLAPRRPVRTENEAGRHRDWPQQRTGPRNKKARPRSTHPPEPRRELMTADTLNRVCWESKKSECGPCGSGPLMDQYLCQRAPKDEKAGERPKRTRPAGVFSCLTCRAKTAWGKEPREEGLSDAEEGARGNARARRSPPVCSQAVGLRQWRNASFTKRAGAGLHSSTALP
jgi:hypothetical protein